MQPIQFLYYQTLNIYAKWRNSNENENEERKNKLGKSKQDINFNFTPGRQK